MCAPAVLRIFLAVPTTTIALVAGWASLAALAAALGPLLPGARQPDFARSIGISSALAAGAMLGVGYSVMSIGLAEAGVAAAVGAVLGIATTYATHLWLGVGAAEPLVHSGRAVTAGALHAAPEGVAIGAAMAVGARFGIFLVATLALHNVWESEVLGARLVANDGSRAAAAGLGVLTNVPQVLLAVAAFALATSAPSSVPFLLGFGFGAITYLCLAELLPESYETAGRTSIAVVVSVAAGVVALLGGSVL